MREYRYPSPIIADRIQQIFDEHNLHDGEVANILDVDRRTPMKYRHGETAPSVRFIRWLCSTYKIDANWLLDLD